MGGDDFTGAESEDDLVEALGRLPRIFVWENPKIAEWNAADGRTGGERLDGSDAPYEVGAETAKVLKLMRHLLIPLPREWIAMKDGQHKRDLVAKLEKVLAGTAHEKSWKKRKAAVKAAVEAAGER